jgi:hypothetical protein
MANIGELFKFLGANDAFASLCKEIEKTNQQIIEDMFLNETVMTELRKIVPDDSIIKNKMDILIGQKRKSQNKPPKQEQNVKEASTEEPTEQQQEQQQEVIEFKYKPIDPSKVIYLDDFAYIELVDHRMRLVTIDYEMYY